jgi:hypothetical protein
MCWLLQTPSWRGRPSMASPQPTRGTVAAGAAAVKPTRS